LTIENFKDKSMTQNKEWDVGVSAIVVRDERVLFVRYAYGDRKGLWTLPGGYAQHDETLDQAALRELREEAGLDGEPCGRWIPGMGWRLGQ
jgi:ADP-ribose pyrophosphatase YjhB (NUDIX family)